MKGSGSALNCLGVSNIKLGVTCSKLLSIRFSNERDTLL